MRYLAILIPAFLAAAAPAAAREIHVDLKNIGFSPASVSAHVGDTVEWNNKDFITHSATAKDGKWDINLPPHATGKMTLKKAGRLDYYCKYHPNMTGVIIVSPR